MCIIFPEWYNDLCEFKYEAKGYLFNFKVIVNDQEYCINFYDNARFALDSQEEIECNGFFQDAQAVILKRVNKIYSLS